MFDSVIDPHSTTTVTPCSQMDVEGYLKKQGWRGSGHSLDHTNRGITKALQISKKVDALGVGLQKYGTVSDQWWMRAYEQGLKDLGTGREGDLDRVKKHGHDRGGLYSRFVKGQPIPGTIDEYIASQVHEGRSQRSDSTRSTAASKNKRKRSGNDADERILKRRQRLLEQTESLSGRATDSTNLTVRSFVDEAIRRGIIRAKEGDSPKTQSASPCDADMAKVLALTGLTGDKQLLKRQHMVRALKRAALQYIDSTQPP